MKLNHKLCFQLRYPGCLQYLFDFLPTDKETEEIEFISDDGDEFIFELEPDYDA